MNILIIGSGGREHAMALALSTSAEKPTLWLAPGNGGSASVGQNAAVDPEKPPEIVAFAKAHAIDLVVVGPEASLVAGVSDACAAAAIPCVGPSQKAAELEGSKAHCRLLAQEAQVPSPNFALVHDTEELSATLHGWPGLPVIKADGLAAGKGVFLPDSKEACLKIGMEVLAGKLGAAGRQLVLEERLSGTEASLFYACSGTDVVALPNARDHKRLLDNDLGPNTGGMGAISPNPDLNPQIEDDVYRRIVQPVLQTMVRRGTPFRGFLYAGIMLTEAGPKLLEFNVRLGDPEAQAILPRLAPGEFLRLCGAMAADRLAGFSLKIKPQSTCAVVVAAPGYPDSPQKGLPLLLDQIALAASSAYFVHAGTRVDDQQQWSISGGRVGAVVGIGENAQNARKKAYEALGAIQFAGMQYRRDIGQ